MDLDGPGGGLTFIENDGWLDVPVVFINDS